MQRRGPQARSKPQVYVSLNSQFKRTRLACSSYPVIDEVSVTVYHLLEATEHERKLLFQLLLLFSLQNRSCGDPLSTHLRTHSCNPLAFK